MNDTHTDIERIVMRRVHMIRILQLVISTVVLAVLTSVAALWGIGREVWVAQVFTNGPDGFLGHMTYLTYAFGQTDIVVQVLVVLTIASFVFLAREAIRLCVDLLSSPLRA